MMANELRAAIEKLHISSSNDPSNEDELIDSFLTTPRPHKRVAVSQEELKQKLEEEFLRPSPIFSTDWLNRLQQ